jgi:hypothetical protein
VRVRVSMSVCVLCGQDSYRKLFVLFFSCTIRTLHRPPLYNTRDILRVGQNRIYTPYMTVYSMISLPKIHRIYMVLANPRHP